VWDIVELTASDIDAVAKIERSCFPIPWKTSAFVAELSFRDAFDWVVKETGENCGNSIIAYICSRLIRNGMYILKIAVTPKRQRQGIATWLLRKSFLLASEKDTRVAFLDVRPSNEPAIKLYKKLGFQTIGIRPNYYIETREDALVMRKSLKEEI